MIQPQISIVIPVYNAAPTIESCLNSISGAVGDVNVEVICIDDGSIDQSFSILSAYKDRAAFPMMIIRQANQGRSAARNKGMAYASSEYIMFVDADDTIPPTALSALVNQTFNPEVDLICGRFSNEKSSESDHAGQYDLSNLTIKSNQAIALMLDVNGYSSTHAECPNWMRTYDQSGCSSVWAKLFRKNIILNNSIQFQHGLRFGEDALFVFDYLQHASKVFFLDEVVYYWNIGTGSETVHAFNEKDYSYVRLTISEWHDRVKHYPIYGESIIHNCISEIIGTFHRQHMYGIKQKQNIYKIELLNFLKDKNVSSFVKLAQYKDHPIRCSQTYKILWLFSLFCLKHHMARIMNTLTGMIFDIKKGKL